MKFAHFADVHIGSWRDPRLKDCSTQAFNKAIDLCISEKVDFALIAGDLFNTSMPAIDGLKVVTRRFKELSDLSIPVYIIAGSHDFSPSGKTMIDVLEEAGLVKNVVKGSIVDNRLRLNFTVDKKTGAKITGMLGRRGMLERQFYESLDLSALENEPGFKIFMLHTALSEFKPKDLDKVDATPLSYLPKGFNYYAGGHVHYIFEKNEPGYGLITYPGALFPANFKEMEEFGHGGLYIVDEKSSKYVPITLFERIAFNIDCKGRKPKDVEQELLNKISSSQLQNAIVTLRLSGKLSEGKTSDIDFKRIFDLIYSKNAYFAMRNTNALESEEFEEIKIDADSIEEIEERIIKEHLGQIKIDNEEQLVKDLMKILNKEKLEGEKNADFEKRIVEEMREFVN